MNPGSSPPKPSLPRYTRTRLERKTLAPHHLPILVWIDCDYYESAKVVFEQLLPYLPSGCVVYFDEYDLHYGSRFTGEAKLVYEINQGSFGEGVELIRDAWLSLDKNRVYRLINERCQSRYTPKVRTHTIHEGWQPAAHHFPNPAPRGQPVAPSTPFAFAKRLTQHRLC